MLINKAKVQHSIWLMLPVSVVIACFFSLVYENTITALIYTALFVLFYGAFIWIPSVLFTYTLESFMLKKDATKHTVLKIFGIETTITFFVILLVFGSISIGIPFVALGMSIIIQCCRWFFLKENNRMFLV